MKRIVSLILSAVLIMLIFAGCTTKNVGERPDLTEQEGESEEDLRGRSTLLSLITDNKKPIVCNGKTVQFEVSLENGQMPIEYGFIVFVDGIRVPFSTNEKETQQQMHYIKFGTDEKKNLKISILAENIPDNKNVQVSIGTIIEPDFKIENTNYINYFPNHSFAPFATYNVVKSKDNTIKCKLKTSISNKYSSGDLTEEIESRYLQSNLNIDGTTSNKPQKNNLDVTNFFELRRDEFTDVESMVTTEKNNGLDMKIYCVGEDNTYRISLYINHQLVPAFEGKDYAQVDVKRNEIKTVNVQISSDYIKSLDTYNHIYFIAVPLNQDVTDVDGERPKKSATNVLYVDTKENVSKVDESFDKKGDVDVTSSQNLDAGGNNHSTGADMNSNFSNQIRNVFYFDDGTILVCKIKSISVYDLKTNKCTKTVNVSPEMAFTPYKLDNGVGFINGNTGDYIIFDTKLNIAKKGKFSGIKSEYLDVCFSNDGKRIAFTEYKNNKEIVYVSDLDLNNKKAIASFDLTNFRAGKISGIDNIHCFKDNVILFSGSIAADNEGNMNSCSGTMTLDGKYDVFKSGDYISSKHNYCSLTMSQLAENNATIKYAVSGQAGLKSFTFNQKNESRTSYVSETGKYIASITNVNNNMVMVNVYDIKARKLLISKKYSNNSNNQFTSLDFCENKGTVLISTISKVEEIKL